MKDRPNYRIILFDDDDGVRNVLAELLGTRGYEVLAFDNPGACPLQLEPACRCGDNQTCADVILSDLEMPGMTGLEFIETASRARIKELCCCNSSTSCDHPALPIRPYDHR